MKIDFASFLVVAMLAGLLPPNSSAIAMNEMPSRALRGVVPTAQVVQSSSPCAQASLDKGCQQQLDQAREAYERLRRAYADRFDDLEQALRTLRSAEPQGPSDLMAKGVPDWLYCVVHPLWCRGL